VRAVAVMTHSAATAHVSVGVHLRATTRLRVNSYPESGAGSPFVSMKIGMGAGQVSVMTHELDDLDRLGALVAEARQSLAHMLGGGTAWERHDDPTVSDNPLDDDQDDDLNDSDDEDEAPTGAPGSRLLYAEGWS
jgi:hypothetical protein